MIVSKYLHNSRPVVAHLAGLRSLGRSRAVPLQGPRGDPPARALAAGMAQLSTLRASAPVRKDKPSFHVAAPQGWINDPNGPIFYKGFYHLFYQHLPTGCTWAFGLCWGHAVSRDLVEWQHLPPAIVPTPGSMDADGCFSGCATLDEDGVPIILYTGVRLRGNEQTGPLPPPECDLQLPFIEAQCSARPVDPEDPMLTYWTKDEVPLLSLPPPNMGLGGWRDPYIIGRPNQDGQDCWSLLIGSGLKDNGGTILVYTSKTLLDGWQLHGELCHGRGNGATTGFMWECPLLLPLDPLPPNTSPLSKGSAAPHGPQHATSTAPDKPLYFFCISPDACTNPSYYWLGAYDSNAKRFDIDRAEGPFRLDMGDVLYAPNTLVDSVNGRTLLWGWNQEKRTKVDAYDYAGCLSLPRVLWLEKVLSSSSGAADGWALHQQPLPELTKLRDPTSAWRLEDSLPPGMPHALIEGGTKLPVPVVSGPFLDLELVFQPLADALVRDGEEARCSASGLLLRSWRSGAEGSAALLYHWDSGVLEVIFEAMDPATLTFSLAAPAVRRVGGRLMRPPAPGTPLALRVFLDDSCLEVFTGSGEVLTARVYRGTAPVSYGQPSTDAGVDIISVDGPTELLHAAAYGMTPAFKDSIIEQEIMGAPIPHEMLMAPMVLAEGAESLAVGA